MDKETRKLWLRAIKVQIAWYKGQPKKRYLRCLPDGSNGICGTAFGLASGKRDSEASCLACLWSRIEEIPYRGHTLCISNLEGSRSGRIKRLRRWKKILKEKKGK